MHQRSLGLYKTVADSLALIEEQERSRPFLGGFVPRRLSAGQMAVVAFSVLFLFFGSCAAMRTLFSERRQAEVPWKPDYSTPAKADPAKEKELDGLLRALNRQWGLREMRRLWPEDSC